MSPNKRQYPHFSSCQPYFRANIAGIHTTIHLWSIRRRRHLLKINFLISLRPPPIDVGSLNRMLILHISAACKFCRPQPQRSVLHVFRGIRGRRHLAKALSLSLVSATSEVECKRPLNISVQLHYGVRPYQAASVRLSPLQNRLSRPLHSISA